MQTDNFFKLDNPTWFALTEAHQHWAQIYDGIKLYPQHICPFGGINGQAALNKIPQQLLPVGQTFFIIGEAPQIPLGFQLKNELICLQMVATETPKSPLSHTIVPLSNNWIEALHELVNLVQPGYFMPQTHLMGNYWGIIKNNQLVAITGERMQLDTFTEISAVITHPDYQRQGMAKQLVSHAVQHNFARRKTPFLHVLDSNIGAIKLYEQLGFYTRRKISFWLIKRLA